ncbi:serine/threonine protein kinase, partial [Candidatus Woesearchaeota archaeon]|nr:serine/threonine protein kinase [Candidatus Woesearchaeota archaeon]
TRPIKHVFVKNNKITMIDFERCYETKNPKNVTQFSQYIIKNFKTKKEFQTILKNYKEKQTEKNYKEILKYIKTIFS